MLHHILWTSKIVNKLSANNCVYFRLWWICFAIHSTAHSTELPFSLDFWCPLPPFVPFLKLVTEWVKWSAKHLLGESLMPLLLEMIRWNSNALQMKMEDDAQTKSKWNIRTSPSPFIFSTLSFLSYRAHTHITSHCKQGWFLFYFLNKFLPWHCHYAYVMCAVVYKPQSH